MRFGAGAGLVALGLLVAFGITACSGGGKKDEAGAPPAPGSVQDRRTALVAGKIDIESAGPAVNLPKATKAKLLGVAQSYVDAAVHEPLTSGEIGDGFAKLFERDLREPATGRDKDALTDGSLGKATKYVESSKPVKISGLADGSGKLLLLSTDVSLQVKAAVDGRSRDDCTRRRVHIREDGRQLARQRVSRDDATQGAEARHHHDDRSRRNTVRRFSLRRMSRARRVVVVAAAFVCTIVVGTAALFSAWLAGVHLPIASGATYMRVEKLTPLAGADRIANRPDAPFYILLVGNDSRPGVGGARGDALHLVGVNPKLKQGSMIDIPRDTCYAGDKINAQNTRGLRASADAVGTLVGVPVAYAVQVDFAGFTSLVDGIGGVPVNVRTEMHDSYSGAYFSPGVHMMNGDAALRFSRDRHDFPNSDITRTANQGSLIFDTMRYLSEKMQSAPGEFKMLALLGRHAQLDGIGLEDLYRLGRVAFSLNPDRMKQAVLPITNGQCLGLGGAAPGLFADFKDDAVLESH